MPSRGDLARARAPRPRPRREPRRSPGPARRGPGVSTLAGRFCSSRARLAASAHDARGLGTLRRASPAPSRVSGSIARRAASRRVARRLEAVEAVGGEDGPRRPARRRRGGVPGGQTQAIERRLEARGLAWPGRGGDPGALGVESSRSPRPTTEHAAAAPGAARRPALEAARRRRRRRVAGAPGASSPSKSPTPSRSASISAWRG